MKDFLESLVAGIVSIVVIFLVCFLMIFIDTAIDNHRDNRLWNDGVHEGCGGHWQYEQAIGTHYDGTDYIYCCDKCQLRETFDKQMSVKVDE